MLLIALKLALALGCAALGWLAWQSATRWDRRDEIPKEWVESREPRSWRRDDAGFKSMIAWQRGMAVLAFVFAGLCLLSVALQLLGVLG